MSKRVCAEPGCPTLINPDAYKGRCTECNRARDRARGSREQRGYGKAHIAARADIQSRIDAGETVRCWRCGIRLDGRAWHLDHSADRNTYRGPACQPCNLELAGRTAH